MQSITDHPMMIDTAKAVPGAVVSASYFFNVTLPDVIQVCTAIYVIGLALQTFWRLYKWAKNRNKQDAQG